MYKEVDSLDVIHVCFYWELIYMYTYIIIVYYCGPGKYHSIAVMINCFDISSSSAAYSGFLVSLYLATEKIWNGASEVLESYSKLVLIMYCISQKSRRGDILFQMPPIWYDNNLRA